MDHFTNLFFDPLIKKLIITVIGLVIIYFVVLILRQHLSKFAKENDTRYKIRKFITLAGYVFSITFLAVLFSEKLGGLHVALGIAGAGIAFSLQEVIASIAGWVALSFGHFYKTGDRVQLGGIKGDVIDIAFLRTTLMETGEWVKGDQYNGRIVRVANSFVFKEPVFNYSADFPFLWDEITIPVAHGSDENLARKIIYDAAQAIVGDYVKFAQSKWQEMLKKYHIEAASVVPTVFMSANENWLDFTIRYVTDYKKRRTVKDKLFSSILEGFRKTDGKVVVAFTSTKIYVAEAPSLDVHISKDK